MVTYTCDVCCVYTKLIWNCTYPVILSDSAEMLCDFAILPIINGLIICSPICPKFTIVAPGNKITSQIRLLVINIFWWGGSFECVLNVPTAIRSKFNPPPHLLAKIYCGCYQLLWPLLHGRRCPYSIETNFIQFARPNETFEMCYR